MEKQTQSLDSGRHFDFQVVVELPNIGHFVAPLYLGKVMEVFPLTIQAVRNGVQEIGLGVLLPPPNTI